MFGFGPGSSSITAGRHDSNKDRAPPPLPTPVSLPAPVDIAPPPASWTRSHTPDLPATFAALKRPQDVGPEHLAAFNIRLQPPCALHEFLSDAPQILSHLPPDEWLQPPDPAAPEPPKQLLNNGRPAPTRREFHVRVSELQFDNQLAFSALSRVPPADAAPPRLVHFRRFWDGLDNMAYYWDTSVDRYLPGPEEDVAKTPPTNGADGHRASSAAHGLSPESAAHAAHLHEPRKKAKTEDAGSPTEASSTGPIHPAFDSFRSASPTQLPTRPPDPPSGSDKLPTGTEPPSNDTPQLTGNYRGNRIGNGAGMPEPYRMDTVRSFIEAVSWAFGVTVAPHRRQPLLTLGNVRFPVRVSSAVWRAPNDRLKARAGWLEGPVLGLQVRPELAFPTMQDSELDTMRELAGLLYLAQERHREGKEEEKPGEGKWWTSKPRWGGGPGGELGEGRGEDDTPAARSTGDGEVKDKRERERSSTSSRMGSGGSSSRSSKKKLSAVELWKELKPGLGHWDPRVKYEAIGREEGNDWDEVFMVSTVVHHMSVLRLHVHRAYLDYISTGVLPDPLPDDPAWCQPTFKRTRWYDFFSCTDRVEAMRALWAIIGYSMRPPKQAEKADVVMAG